LVVWLDAGLVGWLLGGGVSVFQRPVFHSRKSTAEMEKNDSAQMCQKLCQRTVFAWKSGID
jgi:hypothetical protein